MKKLLTGILFGWLLAGICSAQTSVTTTRNDASATYSDVRGFGVSRGCDSFYDSCQVDKNLVVATNPTFEPTRIQSVWVQEDAGTSTGGVTSYHTRNQYVGVGSTANIAATWLGATDTIVQSPTAGLVGCSDFVSSTGTYLQMTANTVSGSNQITTSTVNAFSSASMNPLVGATITGAGIPAGATIGSSSANYSTGVITITLAGSTVAAATSPAGGVTLTETNGDGNESHVVYNFAAGASTPGGTTSGSCGAAPVGTIHVVTTRVLTPANGSSLGGYTGGGGTITADTASPIDGLVSLRMNTLTGGSFAQYSFNIDGGADRFVDFTGTYTITAKVRLNSGTSSLAWSLVRGVTAGRPAAVNCSGTASLGTAGTTTSVSVTCAANEQSTRPDPGTVQLTFTGGGNDIDVDDVTLARTSGNDSTNTTVFRDEYVNGLKAKFYNNNASALKPPFRLGPELQNGETFANWVAPVTTALTTGYSVFGVGHYHHRLPEELALIKAVGAVPYFHLPAGVSVADAVSFVKFLFSTNTSDAEVILRTSTWGHAAPYVGPGGDFNMVYLCFGNELWNYNDAFDGGNMPGIGADPNQYTTQKKREGVIWQAVRGASSFLPAYAQLVSNVQFQNAFGFTTEIAAMPTNGRPDAAETSPYIGLQFSSTSTNEARWRIGLSTPYAWVNVAGYGSVVHSIQSLNACGRSGTTACKVTVYEEGPGDTSACGTSGVTPACSTGTSAVNDDINLQIDNVGAGMGIMTADEWAENVRNGISTQNLFASNQFAVPGPRNNPTTGAPEQDYLWGMAVDYGGAESTLDGANVRARPQMLTAQIVNLVAMPNFEPCTNNAGTYSQPVTAVPSVVPATTVPTLGTTCFFDGAGNYSELIVNRSTTQSFAMGFAGTNATLGTMVGLQFAPSNLDTMNEATAQAPTFSQAQAFTHNAPLNLSNAVLSGTNVTSVSIPPNSVTGIRYQVAGSTAPKMLFVVIGGQLRVISQ